MQKKTADVHRGAAKAKQAEKELSVHGKEAGAKLDETVGNLLHVLSHFQELSATIT
jgi:hypothetical protein